MPSMPKFPLFPGGGAATAEAPEDQAQDQQASAAGPKPRRAAKQAPTVSGDALSKREADTLRPWLVDALEQTSGDLDNLLTATNAAGAEAAIWQLDRMEAEALADMWLRRAMASAVVAVALRQSMSLWAYYQAGVILLPRFWATWGFYAGNGFDIPLPGPVRERRAAQRRGQGQQPRKAQPQPQPTPPVMPTVTPGGPAPILPRAAGPTPQARAAAVAGSAAAQAAAMNPAAAPASQEAAEAAFMRHRLAVNAATDYAGAGAQARAVALAGQDQLDLEPGPEAMPEAMPETAPEAQPAGEA